MLENSGRKEEDRSPPPPHPTHTHTHTHTHIFLKVTAETPLANVSDNYITVSRDLKYKCHYFLKAL